MTQNVGRRPSMFVGPIVNKTTTLTPELAQFYSNPNCNKCYGKGIITISFPAKKDWSELCRCVLNKMGGY